MNLQGRSLAIEMTGEDVALLQRELAELGYKIDPAEVARGYFGNSTAEAVALFQRRHDRAISGVVDEVSARLINAEVDARRKIESTVVPTVPLPPSVTVPAAPPASSPPAPPSTDQPPADQQYVVRGQVRQAGGSVLAGAVVRAVDKDLRHEQPLGETTTDREGNYVIRYTVAQFRRAEAETADLVVRVYGQNGALLVASPVMFNAPREATINLMVGGGVYRGPSEYERFVAALTPVLDGALLAELTDDDVTFLAGETGINAQFIHFIVVAQHLARETNLPPEIFYGFAREGLPTELTPLLAVHANIQRRALERAVRDNIIPMRFGNEVEVILERLRQLMINQAFVYPNATGAVPLGALLATSGLSRQLIERLHTLYTQHVGSIPDFWAALQKDPDFSQDGRVETLRFTMQISSIAHGYVPLVQALQDMRRAGSIRSARDLAGADENDWLRLIQRQMNEKGAGFPADVPGANDKERAINYARMLTSAVEALFPAAVVARRVVRDGRPGTEDLARFFTNNPDFDLGSTHIETYLAAHPRTALAGVASPTRLVEQLKSTQRIFKVTPHYDEMQVLLAAGHDSALSIVQTGQSSFVAAHAQALGSARAAQIFAQADRAASLALGIFTQYSLAFNRTPAAGLPSIAGPTASQFLSSTGPSDGGMSTTGPGSGGGDGGGPGASLPTLFGSLDFCGCDECRSIYSPAAYLVDILHFLSDAAHLHFLSDAAQKMLLASDRRQDIGEIELSCANTTRLLPYVDLVNEVLERAVAQDADLVGATTLPWPQTTWTEEELRANPEHTIEATYTDVLAQATYGWSLPFDLAAEEARAYLEHLGAPRAKLMQAFQDQGTTTPTPDQIALEYLRLTSLERDLITGSTPALPWQYWFKVVSVRVATTAPIDLTSPPMSIDGVLLQADDRVLVKDQPAGKATEQGIYIVSAGGWSRGGDGGPYASKVIKAQAGTHASSTTNVAWLMTTDLTFQTTVVAMSLTAANDPQWMGALKRVPVFLRQSGLTYQELIDLLATSYVNPIDPNDPRATMQVQFHDSSCDLDKATLEIVTPDEKLVGDARFAQLLPLALGRMHRLTRLRRKLGWTVSDLDMAITALKPGDLTGAFITQLAHIQWFLTTFQVPLVNLLSWWSPIQTVPGADGAASLYQQLFQNKTVQRLETGDPFKLNATRTEVDNTTLKKISDLGPSIAAALDIGAADLALIAGPGAEVPDDTLNIANLSHLYRIASLAQRLKLSIREYVSLRALSGINPFDPAHLEDTRRFVDTAASVKASGFSLAELDYLLRQVTQPGDTVAPTDESIAVTLTKLQTGLQKIAADTAVVSDPKGDLTRKKLATVLPAERLDMAMAVITGTLSGPTPATDSATFIAANFSGFLGTTAAVAQLAPLPGGLATLDQRLQYVLTPLMAYLRRVASEGLVKQELGEALKLNAPTINALLTAAITSQRTAPAAKVGRSALAEFLDPIFWDTLKPVRAATTASLPTLAGTPQIDGVTLAAGDRVLVKDQVNVPDNGVYVVSAGSWTRAADADVGSTVHLGMSVLVREGTANGASLWELTAPAGGPLQIGTTPLTFSREPGGPDVPAATFKKLHKAAMIVRKLKITATELSATLTDLGFSASNTRPWFVLRGPTLGWLDLDNLPLTSLSVVGPLFTGWQRLVDVFTLRHALPRGKPDLFALFEQAYALAHPTDPASPPSNAVLQSAQKEYVKSLAARTGWNEDDLTELAGNAGSLGLAFPGDFQNERALMRLKACFALLKRLGVHATQIKAWIAPDVTLSAARDMRKTVKSKYQDAEWLAVAKSLQDILREKQRAAPVSYLVSQSRFRDFRDSNALFEWYLIDTEMSPCQLTTRIAQAICSVQLFVQRSAMNLEAQVLSSDQARWWDTWMKNYRVWEANRKIFLYPENWIQPGLRDDKTPFFKQLENRLLQGELTNDSAEDAIRAYLEQLDEVARLDIVGLYHYHDHYHDTETDIDKETDIQHVFGRTWGEAPVYYYRQFVNYQQLVNSQESVNDQQLVNAPQPPHWTAWEKVDLDIQGDHHIPIVWNRRLYLFWPIFTEKAEKQTDSSSEPPHYMEIQIAWSEYKNGKWTAKKISSKQNPLIAGRQPDTSKWQSPDDRDKIVDQSLYVFKATLESDGLEIRCYHAALVPLPPAPPALDPIAGEFIAALNGLLPALQPYDPYGALPQLAPRLTGVASEEQVFWLGWIIANLDSMSNNIDDLALRLNLQSLIDLGKEAIRSIQKALQPRMQSGSALGKFIFSSCGGAPHTTPFQFDETPLLVPERSIVESEVFEEDAADASDDSLYLWQRDIGPVADVYRDVQVLTTTPGTFHVAYPHTFDQFVSQDAFFYEDDSRVFFVVPLRVPDEKQWWIGATTVYEFRIFYHPYICEAIRRLNREGVDGLMRWPTEQVGGSVVTLLHDFFIATYHPRSVATPGWYVEQEDLDFSYSGAYAQYNWELFFHVPLLIASRLTTNRRFEEAQRWFHYIFDPTSRVVYSPAPHPAARFWKMRKFFDDASTGLPQTTTDMVQTLATDSELQREVAAWRDDPFNPHLIARMRTKGWTYQKAVVMKYLDNLIAWADQLFRQATSISDINEATQLYILAEDILGPRPVQVPRADDTLEHKTYNWLKTQSLDRLSNVLVTIENVAPSAESSAPAPTVPLQVVLSPQTLFFCIPPNDKLLKYWDTVEGQLFKIRHCLNIEGGASQVPPYGPPIDPALLVQAAAAGVDLSSVLSDMNAPLPHYRFTFMLQKANELCADVRALGAELLAALEKRDAEHLAAVRSGHELAVLKAVRAVKEQQIKEAQAALDGLHRYQDVVTARQQYYQTREKVSPGERNQLLELTLAASLQEVGAALAFGASIAYLIPDEKISVDAGATYGGSNVGSALQAFGANLGTTAGWLSTLGTISGLTAGYERRQEEWDHQADLATKELAQVAKQIQAAEVRLDIATTELDNHDLQIDNASEVDSYYHDKFTNEELYDWMVGQISAIYFQSYQLAYDLAKRAERCFQFELGGDTATFLKFGYWDGLKQGLLAGEQSQQDLRRMEIAYLDQNRREFEITKHISLASLDPVALLTLKETGVCFVSLPEALFDADYPGHYMRRIKSVSLTLPCVVGPYTSVNCTLTLLKNSVRWQVQATSTADYPRQDKGSNPDPRFRDSVGATQSIATSSGQNDSGMFELNFRDERYVEFEYSGAISDWRIELPKETNAWDIETLTDVIIHLRYTARDGGEMLRSAAWSAAGLGVAPAVPDRPQALQPPTPAVLFSAKHAFSSEWQRFLHPADTATSHAMQLILSKERFPFQFRNQTIKISKVDLLLKFTDSAFGDGSAYRNHTLTVHLTPAPAQWPPTGSGGTGLELTSDTFLFGGVPSASADRLSRDVADDTNGMAVNPNSWTLEAREDIVTAPGQPPQQNIGGAMDPAFWESTTDSNGSTHARLKASAIEDLFIVVHFTSTKS